MNATHFLDLPLEIHNLIAGYVGPMGGRDCANLGLVDKKCKRVVDALLNGCWKQLFENAPEGQIELLNLMQRVEKSTDSPGIRFQRVIEEFAEFKAILPAGRTPITPADFKELQKLAEDRATDHALVVIWPKISKQWSGWRRMSLTADQIRTWYRDPLNTGFFLETIESLDLSNLQLKVFPIQLTILPEVKDLNLSNNELKSLPESFGDINQLKRLDLSNNKLTSLPESLGNLNQLKQLNIDNNNLTSLPKSLEGKFPGLHQ
jgi:hypothetical protein